MAQQARLTILALTAILLAFWRPFPLLAQVPPPSSLLLRIGSQGSDVAKIQSTLKLLGYYNGEVSGIYDESTVIAVYLFQQAAQIPPTGIVNSATWSRLFPAVTAQPPNDLESSFPSPTQPRPNPSQNRPNPNTTNARPVLFRGMDGPAVRELQQRLRALGFGIGQIDGVFGEQTYNAVVAAQKRFNLEADGVVGPATWRALFR
ncbi:MAG: peptidoglycan-binding protein [Jaaginema sp. PMC 1079.18]|nr:peptidoglycan-binding protein [Jaaginema sp. PMC 1080.18]MEC4849499.1 peptidoglycan-binding protein [Jaaginema sp. PMC 1079.18]MEC4865622.1 peptidoglycan-binding protein [Jaaginema sp. PMC 1078.18]